MLKAHPEHERVAEVNIVQPYARIMSPSHGSTEFNQHDGIQLLRRVEFAARISHASEEQQTLDSYDRFLRAVVIEHGDWSIVEHGQLCVLMEHDRGVQQELTRHRLFSYTIESTRFINYAKKKPAAFIYPRPDDPEPDEDWVEAIEFAEKKYLKLLAKGWRPQEARSVFPLALNSKMLVTGNLRNWRHLLLMRTTKETHPSFRQITIPLLTRAQQCIPIIFEDITPGDKQSNAIRKGK